MALEEYVGSVTLELDGDIGELDAVSADITHNIGRKVVKTMNRHKKAKGIVETIGDYSIRLTVAIPKNKKIDWAAIKGAKLTVEDEDGNRESYLDVFTTSVGKKYSVDNEAMIDLDMGALDHVVE